MSILPAMTTESVAGQVTGTHRGWVAPLCWLTIALEGFDLVVLSVVIPSLLKEPSWGLDPNSTALIATVGLVGVMVGALTIGPLTDLVGRRRAMIGTVVAFSLLTLACAFAPDPWTFGVLRFLAGLGLGGVLPVALAMINETARPGRAGSATTTMMTGYHAGAVLASLLGIVVITSLGLGWRPMFVIGGALAVLLLPALVLRLPESEIFRAEKAGAGAGKKQPGGGNPVAVLFRPGYARATVAFWVASIMGLLLVYGLNTWLPVIMQAAGYALAAGLGLLLTLNVGAVLGLLVAGQVANRIGTRTAALVWFAAAALFLALLTVRLPGATIYVMVLLAGIFTFSSQVLVYAYVGQRYPDTARATALGASSGVGRIGAIVGPLLTAPLLVAGLAYPWGFFMFAAVALIGAAGVAAAGRTRT